MEGVDGIIKDVNLWVNHVEKVTVAQVRNGIKSIFYSILQETPQATGKAVANWRIGINAPDNTYEEDVGDKAEDVPTKAGGTYSALRYRQKGDKKWIEYAQLEQGYKFRQIKLGDVVYITNNVRGDDDDGKSSENYLASLQDPAYWASKLREVNQPYITPDIIVMLHLQDWGNYIDFGGSAFGE